MAILHYIFWILIFFEGVIDLIGLSSAYYKFGIPFVFILLFLNLLMEKKSRMKVPFIKYVGVFIAISIMSNFINGQSIFSLLYFFINTILSYFYFIIIINDHNPNKYIKIFKLIIILYLVQIPVSIFKYLIIGQSEGGLIGTVSIDSGVYSTAIPYFAATVLFSIYNFKKRKIYLILIICYLIFGIIGNKRAILFFMPLSLLIVYLHIFIKLNSNNSVLIFKRIVSVAIISIVMVVITVKSVPTLNPENSNWGSFNIKYTLDYVNQYTSSEDKSFYNMRRKDAVIYFTSDILNRDIMHTLVGNGAGQLVKSKYVGRSTSFKDIYGVRYAGIVGYIQILMQIGVMGIIFYLIFILNTYFFVFKNYRNHPIYLAYLSLTIIILIDFMIYSPIFIRIGTIKEVYFFILGLIYLNEKRKNKILNLIF